LLPLSALSVSVSWTLVSSGWMLAALNRLQTPREPVWHAECTINQREEGRRRAEEARALTEEEIWSEPGQRE
jgi:hypothetical protein